MPRFNEPDKFLLEKWTDARLLEDAVDEVRKKYEQVLESVVTEFQTTHRELDCSKIGLTHGSFGLGREKWPKRNGWPTGFYIEEIRLDNLTSPDMEPPWKTVWVLHANPKEAESRLRKVADKVLKAEAPKWEFQIDSKAAMLFCELEPRKELFDLLLKDESKGFVERMLAHFESMVGFVSVIDELTGTAKPGSK
jgi:hypothetical protein